jgi:molybdopterin synthase sulfur carrier subunit
MINVLYFASLKEVLGVSAEEIEMNAAITDIESLRSWLCRRGEPWQSALHAPRLLAAVNQAMARPETPVLDGDEVAFFPPVTGG